MTIRPASRPSLLELGLVELTSGGFPGAVDVDELYALADRLETDDPALTARLLAQMAVWFTSLGWLKRADPLARRALAVAIKTSDHAAAVQCQVALATLAWTHLDLDDARIRLEDALRRADASGDALLANQPRPRLALTLLWLGRVGEAEALAQQACDEARRTADWSSLTLALGAALGVAVVRGDLQRAEQLGDEAWLALRLSHYRWGAAFVFPALAASRLAAGDAPGARDALMRWQMSIATEDDTSAGMVVEVVELLADAFEGRPIRLPPWIMPALGHWPVRIGAVTVPVVLVGLTEAGACSVPLEPLERALERSAETGMLLADGLLLLLPRLRGLAALADGRLDDARTRLVEAENLAQAIGAEAEAVRAGLDLARTLSRAGELAAARDRARGVAERAARLGLVPLATTATALVAELNRAMSTTRSAPSPAMAVILFTDLVGSTELTERVGDAVSRVLADRLDDALRVIIESCGGEPVPGIRLGDGLLALFPSATGALEFAARAHGEAASLDLALRIGVHAGDMVRAGDIVSGLAVNIAARICAAATPGETLVSETVRDLARTPPGITFNERGSHRLKGVSDPHQLFAASTSTASRPIDIQGGTHATEL